MHKVELPTAASSDFDLIPSISGKAPEFVRNVLGEIAAGTGDLLPVSAIPAGGAFPTATAQWEKRNIAQFIPVWDKDLCIQCGKCVMVCPHAVIRAKVYSPELGDKAPATFQWAKPKWKGMETDHYTLQVAPEDCTGCAVCVDVCPVKSKSDASKKAINMAPQAPLREAERDNWEFFLELPEVDRNKLSHSQVKDLQLLQPLFEFSGACAGCGETAYIKLLTQLFGDRLYVANATGCSSIYGGNLPTTPYSKNAAGRGPTWANSLFEDNAEFGFGMRTALDQQKTFAEVLVTRLAAAIGPELAADLVNAPQKTEAEIDAQRERVKILSREARRQSIRPTHATCSPSPTPWFARASGSWAATDGRSTSASADSITSSAPARTSMSSFSTPRSTRTPVASRPKPRRAAQLPSLPPAGKAEQQKRPGHGSRQLRLCICCAGRPRRQRQPCRQGLPGGRSARWPVDHHRLLKLHRSRLRPGAWTRAAETRRPVRLLAADALQPGAAREPARTRSSSIPRRRRSGSRIMPIAKHATPCSRAAIPNWQPHCSRKHRTTSSASGASTPPAHPCPVAARHPTLRPQKSLKRNWQPRLPEDQND